MRTQHQLLVKLELKLELEKVAGLSRASQLNEIQQAAKGHTGERDGPL